MKKITLTKTTGGSFKCVLPKHLIEELGWKDKEKIEVKKIGKYLKLFKE